MERIDTDCNRLVAEAKSYKMPTSTHGFFETYTVGHMFTQERKNLEVFVITPTRYF